MGCGSGNLVNKSNIMKTKKTTENKTRKSYSVAYIYSYDNYKTLASAKREAARLSKRGYRGVTVERLVTATTTEREVI